MFRNLATLVLGALAFTALAPTSEAGTSNRSIRDVRIVHPPGTPPGTWRVQAALEFFADDTVARPADFSYAMNVLLNGVVIDTVVQTTTLEVTSTPCGPCVGEGCGFWFGPNNNQGQCRVAIFGSGLTLCGCVGAWHSDGGSHSDALRTTDVITVTITPMPGSLTDVDLTDDSMSVPVPSLPTGTSFCSGDGSLATPCPCSNFGAPGHGCANSVNPSGAKLAATGWTGADASTGTDMITLHGSEMPGTATAIYIKMDGIDAAGAVFGDGILCGTGNLIRLRTKINVGGASQFPEPADPSVSVRGATPPGSGLVARYQVYYRNAAGAFCPPATFNVSNGVELEW